MDLNSSPELLKFIRSTSVALPFDRDPWAVVAGGLRVERPLVLRYLRDLMAEGALLGVWGEPNPAIDEGQEVLMEFEEAPPDKAEGAVVRWKARRREGGWLGSVMALVRSPGAGARARRFLKAGFALTFNDDPGALLLPDEDRTRLLTGERFHLPPMSYEEAVFSDQLFAPVRFNPEEPLWEWIGRGSGFGEEEARLLARRLVYHQVWRRFALRYDLGRLGWKGCGLATWEFPEGEGVAQEAAKALAALRGTADVALREPREAGGPVRLMALWVGRGEGDGESAAREVARQWSRPLAGFEAVEVI